MSNLYLGMKFKQSIDNKTIYPIPNINEESTSDHKSFGYNPKDSNSI